MACCSSCASGSSCSSCSSCSGTSSAASSYCRECSNAFGPNVAWGAKYGNWNFYPVYARGAGQIWYGPQFVNPNGWANPSCFGPTNINYFGTGGNCCGWY